MQGRSARPATAMDWNSSDLSGSLPRESFDWLPVYERPYYAFVSDQAGPLQIWYYGASPLRWQPQDDAVEEVQLRVGEQFDVGGECLLRLAAIAGRPALAYHEISSGNLHYVRLSVD
ncbi:MAG: hypothetical protein R3F46_00460 [bacterium]